ncbi:MAG: hypothetical protein JNN15_21170, partial [Blastocatellia bacterium]|nr:hypothetical protein [Blastocatellia bacterium]
LLKLGYEVPTPIPTAALSLGDPAATRPLEALLEPKAVTTKNLAAPSSGTTRNLAPQPSNSATRNIPPVQPQSEQSKQGQTGQLKQLPSQLLSKPISTPPSATSQLSNSSMLEKTHPLPQKAFQDAERSGRNSSTSNITEQKSSKGSKIDPKKLEKLNTLTQYRKVALVVLLVMVVILGVLFSPFGKPDSTKFALLQQNGCVEVSSLDSKKSSDGVGDLEAWLNTGTGVQFIRRDEITAEVASQEVTKLQSEQKEKAKIQGFWCPRGENVYKEDPSLALFPIELSFNWILKPVGANADRHPEIRLQLSNGQLEFKESLGQKVLDRSQDILKATYFDGQRKLVVRLNETTSSNAPTVREMLFYLPSAADPVAAAEGRMADSTWQVYLAQSTNSGKSFNWFSILTFGFIIGIGLDLIYLILNYFQIRTVKG